MRNLSQKVLSVLTVGAMVAGLALPLVEGANAGGVALTLSVTEVAESAAGVTFDATFTAEEAITGNGTTSVVTFSYDSAYTVNSVDLVNSTNAFTSGAISCNTAVPGTVTCTLALGDDVAGGLTPDLLTASFDVNTPATQASYAFGMVTSGGDFGAALQYVGDDNDVTVTANVTPSLSFNIRTLADDADTNICDLGTVTTTSLPNGDLTVDAGQGECGYALAVGTNAANGFQVQIASDDLLDNASDAIANIANGAPFTAGTEAYGLDLVQPAETGRDSVSGLYDQDITVDAPFTANAFVPQAAANFVSYTGGIEYTVANGELDTTRVMHGMTVGSGTPAGYYDQVVTYTVTANF